MTKQDPAFHRTNGSCCQTRLQKYLKVKRIKHPLDSETVLPVNTDACEYLYLNIDKMHLFIQGEMVIFASLHSADGTGDAASRWHFVGQGMVLPGKRVRLAVKHSHLLAFGPHCLRRLGFSCQETQFCSTKSWPNPFQQELYLHSWVINYDVHSWLAFILAMFKHRSEWGLQHVGYGASAKVNGILFSLLDLRPFEDLLRISHVSFYVTVSWIFNTHCNVFQCVL